MRNNSRNRWIGATVFLALGAAGIFLLSGPAGSVPPAILLDAVSAGDHTQGASDGKAILVEYGDYQCPACSAYHPIVTQAIAEFGNQITFVYRHFPLRQIHRQADLAARAAESAGLQGKFWEMHALLYERQKMWAESLSAKEKMTSYARELGLDETKFLSDFDSDQVKEKVENDLRSGVRAGVRGTPTFFLNGKELANPGNLPGLRQEIQAVLPTS